MARMNGMDATRVVTLASPLDGSTLITSEALLETATTLSEEEAEILAKAIVSGQAHLEVFQSATAGSLSATITAIEFSIDGTNYATLVTFGSATTLSADGQKALQKINLSTVCGDHRITKVRLVMGGSAPDSNNKAKLKCDLVMYVPRS